MVVLSEWLKVGIVAFIMIIAMAVIIAGNYFHQKKLRDQDFNEMYRLYEESKKKTDGNSDNKI